jgi:hypothetical protein
MVFYRMFEAIQAAESDIDEAIKLARGMPIHPDLESLIAELRRVSQRLAVFSAAARLFDE